MIGERIRDVVVIYSAIQWNLSKADTIGTPKIVHYIEGVPWSGVYYTLCGLYWEIL